MSNLNPLYKGFLVSGYVWNNNQQTIANANIIELQTGNSVQANEDGYFEINVSDLNNDLRFSHAGYDYDTLKASEFKSYIELYPSTLDQVVVTNNSKSSSNGIFWFIGGLAALFAYSKISSSDKKTPKTIKV
jgi:hypothetical protein